jgi:hypothetical protein
VGNVFKRGVSEELKQWALHKAKERWTADNSMESFELYLIYSSEHIDEDVLLEQYLKARSWTQALSVLKTGVSPSLHDLAIEKIIRLAPDYVVRSVFRDYKKAQLVEDMVIDLLNAAERGLTKTVNGLRKKLQ